MRTQTNPQSLLTVSLKKESIDEDSCSTLSTPLFKTCNIDSDDKVKSDENFLLPRETEKARFDNKLNMLLKCLQKEKSEEICEPMINSSEQKTNPIRIEKGSQTDFLLPKINLEITDLNTTISSVCDSRTIDIPQKRVVFYQNFNSLLDWYILINEMTLIYQSKKNIMAGLTNLAMRLVKSDSTLEVLYRRFKQFDDTLKDFIRITVEKDFQSAHSVRLILKKIVNNGVTKFHLDHILPLNPRFQSIVNNGFKFEDFGIKNLSSEHDYHLRKRLQSASTEVQIKNKAKYFEVLEKKCQIIIYSLHVGSLRNDFLSDLLK
jgi:hypothetical protein